MIGGGAWFWIVVVDGSSSLCLIRCFKVPTIRQSNEYRKGICAVTLHRDDRDAGNTPHDSARTAECELIGPSPLTLVEPFLAFGSRITSVITDTNSSEASC